MYNPTNNNNELQQQHIEIRIKIRKISLIHKDKKLVLVVGGARKGNPGALKHCWWDYELQKPSWRTFRISSEFHMSYRFTKSFHF